MLPVQIVTLIEIAAAARGVSPGTVGREAGGSGDCYGRLRGGSDITSRRATRIVQRLSDHWPADAEWPTNIPRPAPSPDAAPNSPPSARDGRAPSSAPGAGRARGGDPSPSAGQGARAQQRPPPVAESDRADRGGTFVIDFPARGLIEASASEDPSRDGARPSPGGDLIEGAGPATGGVAAAAAPALGRDAGPARPTGGFAGPSRPGTEAGPGEGGATASIPDAAALAPSGRIASPRRLCDALHIEMSAWENVLRHYADGRPRDRAWPRRHSSSARLLRVAVASGDRRFRARAARERRLLGALS